MTRGNVAHRPRCSMRGRQTSVRDHHVSMTSRRCSPHYCGALIAALLVGPAARATAQAPYRNAALPVEERVRDLLGRMTLEEKFWQLFMIPGDLDDPTHDYSHGVVRPADRAGRRRSTPRARTRPRINAHPALLRRARRGSAFRSSRSRKRVHGLAAATAPRCSRRRSGSPRRGTRRSWPRVAAAIARRDADRAAFGRCSRR